MLARRIVLLGAGTLALIALWFGARAWFDAAPSATMAPSLEPEEEHVDVGELARPRVVDGDAVENAAGRSEVSAKDDPAESGRSIRLFGQVTYADGVPCVEAEMRLYANGRVRRTYTDGEGRYGIRAALVPGLRLEAGVVQHADQLVEVDTNTSADELQYDFVMQQQQGVMVVVLGDDGEPLAIEHARGQLGAQRLWYDVFVSDFDPRADATRSVGELYVALVHQECGRLWRNEAPRGEALVPGAIGTVFLEGELPRWISLVVQDRIVACERIADPRVERVTFVVPMEDLRANCRTLRGTIVDAETLQPLAAKLFVMRDGANAWEQDVEEGWFEIPCLGPREDELLVISPGHATLRRELSLDVPGVLDLGTLALQAPVRISGVVERPSELDAETVTLELFPVGAVDTTEVIRRDARLGQPFVVEGLEPGEYVLVASCIERAPTREVVARMHSKPLALDLRSGSRDGISIRLEPTAWLELEYEYQDEEPFPVCVVLDAEGRCVMHVELMGRTRRIGVIPGDYTLEVRRYGETPQRFTARVPEQGASVSLE
ncbi:MAG: hypothetical protein KDC14_01260 [Planctomycetes bacterium]|nr:hypothetical protein [Planctomycetota bacterium]